MERRWDKDGRTISDRPPEQYACECGHDMTHHANSQWRPTWPCEYPDCECDNFQEKVG